MAAHGWASCSCSHGGAASYSGAFGQEEEIGCYTPRKTDVAQAPRSASARGHGRKSVKVIADQPLVNVGVGTSDELPLVCRQSFKDGRYSPSTGMEKTEWQKMLE
jgi:hypothetical protein